MPAKKIGKTGAKRPSSGKTAAKKTKKKKTLKKKASKKITTKKKSAKKEPATKKKSSRAGVRKAADVIPAKEPMTVEPGPAGLIVPPVEEPAATEEAIGTVTHYYSHLGVAVVQINKGMIRTGDTIRVKGHTTDFTQQVESMEYEHQHVEQASPGQSVGLKVTDHAREHDILFRLK